MATALLLLLVLILMNGMLAMSEIAIVSSRRARLMQMAEDGSRGARHALSLASEPTRFLSTVQVGITSIGILSGAVGEASIADRLTVTFAEVPLLAPYARTAALGVMVVVLTYVSLILGELAPKRLAMTHPERIASMVARFMQGLARVGRPIVHLLSVSTDTVLRLIGIRAVKQPSVTIEEIRVMLEQGAEEGTVEPHEHAMVTNVLNLDERHVGSVLTPRADVVFLDVRDTPEAIRDKLKQEPHSVFPACEGSLDNVLGFVRVNGILDQLLDEQPLDLHVLVEPPLFVPETMTVINLLEHFKRTHLSIALVVNEFGDVEGLVSLADVMSSIVGDLPAEADEEPSIVLREDGSWLVDGALDFDTVARTIGAESLRDDEDRQHYHTLGGLAMLELGRVPRTGDTFEKAGYRFEIVDMDGNRVDRVLISRSTGHSPSAA
jgi:putative hemolysin